MDTTIIAAIIAAIAALAAAILPLLIKSRNKPKMGPHGEINTLLYVARGKGWIGPIDMGLYYDHNPEALLSPSMDDAFGLPPDMRSDGPRMLFWKEGQIFLNSKMTYGEQGVKPGDTLLLTDIDNIQMVIPTIGVIASYKKKA